MCGNDPYAHAAVLCGDDVGIAGVGFMVEAYTETAKPPGNEGPHGLCVFADAARKDQRIESVHCCRQCAGRLADLIAEHVDGLCGMRVGGAIAQKEAHVGGVSRNTEKTRPVVDQVLNGLVGVGLVAEKIQKNPGIEIAAAGSHHEAAGWRESHGRIDGLAKGYGRHARTVAEMGDDETLALLFGGQGAEDVFIRQAMKTIFAHTLVP